MENLTYSNPIWPGPFADPFVFRTEDRYIAYGTGPFCQNGRAIPTLASRDLVSWEHMGGVLEPIPGAVRDNYWAPEAAYRNGKYYLYFSVEFPDDPTQRLRVAVADKPEGPYRDSGRNFFGHSRFAIDPHPFCDPKDGRWYLFFAMDFLDGRAGTGTAVVPLSDDMLQPAGEIHPVLRANADWQIFERNRLWMGKTWEAWHTVEGPFVVRRDSRYYCFYSGGNWQTPGYGVSYGVADHVLGPYRHAKPAGPLVLQGVDNRVIGPGHNSVVQTPEGRDYIVYHAWDVAQTNRRICIDPLVWTLDGPRCLGPTTGLQNLLRR